LDQKFFADLIKSLPLAYAYHKVVFHNDDIARITSFDANASFEKWTGLDAKTIIGKKVTEVLPGIREAALIGLLFTGRSHAPEKQRNLRSIPTHSGVGIKLRPFPRERLLCHRISGYHHRNRKLKNSGISEGADPVAAE
jgi:hypothetical protein